MGRMSLQGKLINTPAEDEGISCFYQCICYSLNVPVMMLSLKRL